MINLFTEEIKWVLKNSFESAEFLRQPFHLGWLLIPKKNKKKGEFKNSVKLKPIDKKDFLSDRSIPKFLADLIGKIKSKMANKLSQSKSKYNNDYKIRRVYNDGNLEDVLSKRFKKKVNEILMNFIKNSNNSKPEKDKLSKKGNFLYFKMFSAENLISLFSNSGNNLFFLNKRYPIKEQGRFECLFSK